MILRPKRELSVRELTLAAVVAAVYFVLCYFGNIFQLTFGPVQVRLGEALTVLPFLFPATAPGVALGCLLTNVLSPYGPIDMVVGTLATAVAAWLTTKMPRWYLAALPPIVINALLLPPMWAWAEAGAVNGAFWAAYWFNLWTFVAGEAIACYVLGTVLLKALPKVKFFRPMIPAVHLAHL
ncbi:QueT transporter family protein [Pseudoflavonifractor capillosus]|uniref:QueT transporter family protein n=1 Tax=Pseudoflavonifractor capillosus TaxID=106588 RepID=A0A921SS63_9FIRM|nr:QueT transporter family protein [Pseudoflavonifractor capillosus]HJG86241.1 QueT transporter family protein [Pseudoflavonifractor capillosus]